MEDLSRRLAELSPEKRVLLLRALQQGGAEFNSLPLSYAQQRLWFLDQLEPNTAFYNVPAAVRLTGDLSLQALTQTFNEIVRRHEVLRTTFININGQPLQIINPQATVEMPVLELSELPEADREAEAQRLATAEAQRPFDLSIGPLFRVQVLRLSQTEHILLCTMHHIVSDGWSMGILIHEVATLYEAFSQGRPSALPELPIQYADYSIWQRQWLTGEVLESQLSYWREQLSGAPSVLELPTDHPRPAVQSFRGAAHRIELSAELTESLRKISRTEGVTLFMALLSAFSVLLSRLSGQDDIVVGTPIANRTRVETESLIGFFVNTLVLRTKVEARESFRALLARVREVTLGAYSHQEVPFEKLVEELQPDRDLSHSPLFQVLFTLQNAPLSDLKLRELTLSWLKTDDETSKFDLMLELTDTQQGLIGRLEYSTDLFEAQTIGRMVSHLESLLTGIVANPDQSVSEVPILTAEERRRLLTQPGGAKSNILVFDQELLEQRRYWADKLYGLAPATPLQLVAAHARADTPLRETLEFTLEPQLCRKLSALTNDGPFLLYTALLAALKVCLYKYTHDSTVVVGSPAYRSNEDEWPPRNALAIVDEVSDQLSFRQLLLGVRQTLLEAYERQRFPYDRLLQDLFHTSSGSSDGQPRLFEVALLFAELHGPWPETGEGLKLEVRREGGSIRVLVEYERSVYEREWVERFWKHYEQALRSGTEEQLRAVAQLTLLTEGEREQLLVEWNQTAREYPRERCVHELFEEQAERAPEAVAIVYGGEEVSYRELNRRANQLAHYLREQGVGPEVMVGLCVERSVEMVVGLLGILKAGGAYVPLDPEYPSQRLSFMLDDSGVGILLTQSKLAGALERQDLHAVALDADWKIFAQESVENPQSTVEADNLAYVIYTSGSTGQPKGTQIQHGALLNLIFWHQRSYAVTPADRATQLAGIGFDACVWELWPYLAAGSSVYLPDDETRGLPERLLEWIRAKGVTVSFLPTPLAERVIDVEWPEGMALRALLTGGDRLHQYAPPSLGCELINHYGPTEAAVVATSALVPTASDGPTAPPIGRPIANTEIYLLDEQLEPVPVGVAGELYIGGAGLARGYLKRPDLTADRFLPHPFSTEPGARLYRTGDLAKYLPDGNIEFLGRIDQQIKLRGYRIELGEIETVLGQHPEIEQAVVTLTAQGSEQRLVAYLVAERELQHSELRSYLKERLPDYMIPSAFVQLEELPLTPNGKIDRRALPEPGRVRGGAEQEYAAAQTPIEELLVGIWEEVLGVEGVGVHDNFFELGGHSLLATQLISRVRDVFQVELPLRSVFELSTVEKLAGAITQKRIEQEDADEIARLLGALEEMSEEEARANGSSANELLQPSESNKSMIEKDG